MKVTELKILSTYSCQGCFQDFKTKFEIVIEPFIWPVCSKRCEFKVIYRIIKHIGFSDKTLELMQKIVEKKEDIDEFTRHRAIFVITKHYANIGLSSIKVIWTRDRQLFGQTRVGQKWTKGQQNPPYVNRGVVPVLVPKFESVQNKSLSKSPIKQEVLKRWF